MTPSAGRCAVRKFGERLVCTARSMEDMMARCQFYKPVGTSCKYLTLGSYHGCRCRSAAEFAEEK